MGWNGCRLPDSASLEATAAEAPRCLAEVEIPIAWPAWRRAVGLPSVPTPNELLPLTRRTTKLGPAGRDRRALSSSPSLALCSSSSHNRCAPAEPGPRALDSEDERSPTGRASAGRKRGTTSRTRRSELKQSHV